MKPRFLMAGAALFRRLGRAQAEHFPVLHAAAVPLDFVCRVADFQQALDVSLLTGAPWLWMEKNTFPFVGDDALNCGCEK